MKVKIEMTLEVDPKRWADEYGIEESQVREDVKSYVIHWAESTPVPLIATKTNMNPVKQPVSAK